jgi:hypothetical protein
MGRWDERFLHRVARPADDASVNKASMNDAPDESEPEDRRGAHRASRPAEGPAYGRRGLGLPGLAALVVAASVAIGFGIHALVSSGSDSSDSTTIGGKSKVPIEGNCVGAPSSGSAQAALAVVVGPAQGTDVPSYIEARRAYLTRCGTAAPDERVTAIVSLSGTANPAGAAALVGDVSVVAAYVRLPGGGPLTLPIPNPLQAGTNQTASITAAYTALTSRLNSDAVARPAAAATDQAMAAALTQNCGCVYALAVSAPLRTLVIAASNRTIRLVDAAPLGFGLDRISARPLLPTELVGLDPAGTPRVFGS